MEFTRIHKGVYGAMMTVCKGARISVSRKHKLTVGSSTELERINIANLLGIMMWGKYFMEAQGYTIKNNAFLSMYQVLHPTSKEGPHAGRQIHQTHQEYRFPYH